MLPKTSNVFGLALALAVTMVSFGAQSAIARPLQHHHRLYAMYRGPSFAPPATLPYAPEYDFFAMYQRTRSRGRDIPSCRVLESSASYVTCRLAHARMNIATFNKTAMSLGRIERAILAIVDVEDEYEQSYAAEDLAIDIFRPEKPHPDWWPTQAQHVAVTRAIHLLARKFPERFALTGGKGRLPLWRTSAPA